MSPISRSAGRDALPPRLKGVLTLTAIAVFVVLLQPTPMAPFPHSADGFLGGLAVSTAIGWPAWRD